MCQLNIDIDPACGDSSSIPGSRFVPAALAISVTVVRWRRRWHSRINKIKIIFNYSNHIHIKHVNRPSVKFGEQRARVKD